jgi:Zn-dependent oligopeptidase
MRLDGFKAKTTAEKNLRKSGEWEKMGDEQRRLVEKMVLDGKRAGLALPEKECEVLMKLKRELSQACLDFNVGMTSSVFRRYANRVCRRTSTPRSVSLQEGSDASFVC